MGALSNRKRTARKNLLKARVKLHENRSRRRVEKRTRTLQVTHLEWTNHHVYPQDIRAENEHDLQAPYVPNVLLWDDRGVVSSSEVADGCQETHERNFSPGTTPDNNGTRLDGDSSTVGASVSGTNHELPVVQDLGLQGPDFEANNHSVSVSDLGGPLKRSFSSTGTDETTQPVEKASRSYLRNYKEIFRASKKPAATNQFSVATKDSWVVEGVCLDEVLNTHGQRLSKSKTSERQGDTATNRYLVIRLD